MNTIQMQSDGTYRYKGLVLLQRAEDGTYWVSGYERWMTVAQMDAALQEQCA